MTTDGSATPQLGQQVANHQNLAERERDILMCQQLTNLINAGYSEVSVLCAIYADFLGNYKLFPHAFSFDIRNKSFK